MLPTQGDVHVNQPLTNFSLAFTQESTEWGADKTAPCVASEKPTDSYFTFDRGYWFRDEMKVRGPGSLAAEIGMGISTGSYAVVPYSVAAPLPDMVQDSADAVLDLDRAFTMQVTLKERIRREKAFAAAAMAGSIWTGLVTGVSGSPGAGEVKQWNDSAATPLKDITAQKTAIQLLTGYEGNVLSLGKQAWDALSNHPEIVDRIKYGQTPGSPAIVTRQAVAQLMGLEEIVVLGGVETTSNEGAANTQAFIAGKVALLTYRAPVVTRMSATAIATFCWKRPGSTDLGTRIKKYYSNEREAQIIEMNSAFVHKVLAPDLGVYFASIVA